MQLLSFLGRLFTKDRIEKWGKVDDIGCFVVGLRKIMNIYSLNTLHKFGGKACQGIKLEDLLYSCLLRLSEKSRIDVANLFSIQLIISL